jgi:hydroxyacylglutathione hydrolase
MIIQRFEAAGLAHYSYLLGSQGKAVVIDPRRDVDAYIDFAREKNLKITHIVETHIHADYASGATALAEATGAEMWLSAYDTKETFEYQFPHHEFHDDEEFTIGDLRVVAVHTPGHTPEHLSFLVYDSRRCGQPMALFTGDFIFSGSIGRPDLLGEEAKRNLAEAMYDSVNKRISALPDGVEVYPAHGAGSLCGTSISDRAQTTLGYERFCNIFMVDKDRSHFVEHLLETVPEFPDYYRRMKKINSEGPRILNGIPGSGKMTVEELKSLQETAIVVDIRRPEAFAGAHVPGSINIGAGPSFGLWAGMIISPERPIVLISEDGNTEESRRALIRVGLDHIRGWLTISEWILSGGAIESAPLLDSRNSLDGGKVIDVRGKAEFTKGHIEGAKNIPLPQLQLRIAEVPHNGVVPVICGTGYRASIGASILMKAGIPAANIAGGMTAWSRTHSQS